MFKLRVEYDEYTGAFTRQRQITMIKFFRGIRQKLLSENKFSKYLIYAVGEIVLVVIGILIALNINNANEKRKNQNQINSILKQVQSELLTSIEKSESIMKDYMYKDSLIYMVMTNKVTYDDYRNKKISGLTGIVSNYIPLEIQNNGYLNLMNHINNLPQDLDSLATDLKRIYVNDFKHVNNTNTLLKNTIINYLDWTKQHTTFMADSYFTTRTLSDKEIDFYLNDPYYKMAVSEHFMIGLQNHYTSIAMFRYHAYNAHKKISSYLNLKKGLSLSPSPFEQDVALYKNYLGTYASEIDTIIISSNNNEFVLQALGGTEKYSIIPVDTVSFIPSPDYFYYLKFDENRKVIGVTMRIRDDFTAYTKIE